jgi:hypothetical protein
MSEPGLVSTVERIGKPESTVFSKYSIESV